MTDNGQYGNKTLEMEAFWGNSQVNFARSEAAVADQAVSGVTKRISAREGPTTLEYDPMPPTGAGLTFRVTSRPR